MEAITQSIFVPERNISVYVRREDLLHPTIPGNKFRKLKYNLLQAKVDNHDCLLTFGGAFSNHVAAVAQAGKLHGFNTIGIIRGDELSTMVSENPTLAAAKNCGMNFKFISRKSYRNKEDSAFLSKLEEEFGRFYLLPEGGTNALAVKGCEEILTDADVDFDYICCASGTGGTASGIIRKASANQKVLVFPALKGRFAGDDIRRYVMSENWEVIGDYHFGGYAKVNAELIGFINDFYRKHHIPLDPIYTGKLFFGVMDLVGKGYFPRESKILIIHTGGIQGINGMNKKLRKINLPIIEIDV